jgi:hypothetical protein
VRRFMHGISSSEKSPKQGRETPLCMGGEPFLLRPAVDPTGSSRRRPPLHPSMYHHAVFHGHPIVPPKGEYTPVDIGCSHCVVHR